MHMHMHMHMHVHRARAPCTCTMHVPTRPHAHAPTRPHAHAACLHTCTRCPPAPIAPSPRAVQIQLLEATTSDEADADGEEADLVTPVQSEAVKAHWAEAHDVAGRLLYDGMSALGGLWVKQGQYLASRADLVRAPTASHAPILLPSY